MQVDFLLGALIGAGFFVILGGPPARKLLRVIQERRR